jgi:IS5 family transposase
VLVKRNPNVTLWEAILPPGFDKLPPELARVDALLDDDVFFAPYTKHFSALFGRPSIPIETYLRMMWLKFRYDLGYATLVKEVGDSISWSRFCRIALGQSLPHSTTLIKITNRCGPETIAALNQALLEKAAGNKVLRAGKVRGDTTVVEANVCYPTDSGLLVKLIGMLTTLVALVHITGFAPRTTVRDRRRAAGRRARSISAHLKLRNNEAKAAVRRITGELADLAEKSLVESGAVLENARRGAASAGTAASGKATRALSDLETAIERGAKVLAQAHERLAGDMPESATRLVSLHDPDARPIKKGRLGKPVEFGYKAQVVDNADGAILDHSMHVGNVPDAPLPAPAVGRIKTLVGRSPKAVTADRGYSEAKVDTELAEVGVTTTVIPKRGKVSE